MWVGAVDPPVLQGRIEESDDRALFGKPLEELSADDLLAYCRRFNITTLVANVNDYQTRVFLDASAHFQPYYNNGFFFVYRVKGYENVWIDARNAAVELVEFEDDRVELRVRAARADATVSVKIFAYPLWRAVTDAGQSLPISRDEMGLMQVALPPGEEYAVLLRYENGIAEEIGNSGSLLSALVFLGSGAYGFTQWVKSVEKR